MSILLPQYTNKYLLSDCVSDRNAQARHSGCNPRVAIWVDCYCCCGVIDLIVNRGLTFK